MTPDQADLTWQSATSGEAIVKVDWSHLAEFWTSFVGDSTSTQEVGEYVADALPADLLSLPIHLIGHSRGASLNVALAQRLSDPELYGKTTLEPAVAAALRAQLQRGYLRLELTAVQRDREGVTVTAAGRQPERDAQALAPAARERHRRAHRDRRRPHERRVGGRSLDRPR